jgi:hypothetical protein
MDTLLPGELVFLMHSSCYLALLDSGRCLSVTSPQRHRALGGCVMQSSRHRVSANPQFIIPACVVAESAHDIPFTSIVNSQQVLSSVYFVRLPFLPVPFFFRDAHGRMFVTLPSFSTHGQ